MSSELQFERLTKAAVAFLYTICAQSYSVSMSRPDLLPIILWTHCYFDIEGVVILWVYLQVILEANLGINPLDAIEVILVA